MAEPSNAKGYLLGGIAGIIFVPFMYMFGSLLVVVWGTSDNDFMLLMLLGFAIGYSLLGGALGFLWPEDGWLMGIFASAGPAAMSFYLGVDFISLAVVTLLSACACAHTAAKLHLKYAEVK